MKQLVLVGSFVVGSMAVSAQHIEISGYVSGEHDVENIHIINETAQKFTITNKQGYFKIPVQLNDVVRFSSIQYEVKTFKITQNILNAKTLDVILEHKLNTLKTVHIGRTLSGDLSKDIGQIEGKAPINFYDLGIPGYTGKKLTQSERRLEQAGTFKPSMLLSIPFGGMPLDPLINSISGRTKMLKAHVQHEKQEFLLAKIRERLSESLFHDIPLEEHYRMDFFYFCEMDAHFYVKCHNVSDFEILAFLKEKLLQYKENQNKKGN